MFFKGCFDSRVDMHLLISDYIARLSYLGARPSLEPRPLQVFILLFFVHVLKICILKMPTTTLQEHQSYSVQETARKNTKYSRNETILKIGHLSKAIAFAKLSVCVKNLIKNARNKRSTVLTEHYSNSVPKNVRKTTKYSRNETISKISNSPCKG